MDRPQRRRRARRDARKVLPLRSCVRKAYSNVGSPSAVVAPTVPLSTRNSPAMECIQCTVHGAQLTCGGTRMAGSGQQREAAQAQASVQSREGAGGCRWWQRLAR